MIVKLNRTLQHDPTTWGVFCNEFNVTKIKKITNFNEKVEVNHPTMFVIQENGVFVAVGYCTDAVTFNTIQLDPTQLYYSNNTFSLSLRSIHTYLLHRLDLLEKLHLQVQDMSMFDTSRKVLLYVFRASDLDMTVLYNREVQYLKKIETKCPLLFKTISGKRTVQRMYDDLKTLYTDQCALDDDFLPVYTSMIRRRSAEWK